MGNWKEKLQVNDLSEDSKLEMQCRKCNHVRYLTKADLIKRNAGQRHLNYIENRSQCIVFGCKGKMRLSLTYTHKVSAFIGGIA